MAAPAAEPPRRLKAVEDYETSNGVKIAIVSIFAAHPLDSSRPRASTRAGVWKVAGWAQMCVCVHAARDRFLLLAVGGHDSAGSTQWGSLP